MADINLFGHFNCWIGNRLFSGDSECVLMHLFFRNMGDFAGAATTIKTTNASFIPG